MATKNTQFLWETYLHGNKKFSVLRCLNQYDPSVKQSSVGRGGWGTRQGSSNVLYKTLSNFFKQSGNGKSFCFSVFKIVSSCSVTRALCQCQGRAAMLKRYGASPRRGSRIFGQGGPAEFWPKGGALSQKCSQNRGFSLKIAWKLHDFKQIWGGPGPCICHWVHDGDNKDYETVIYLGSSSFSCVI